MFLGTNDSYHSYPFKGLIIYFEDGTQMVHPTIMLNLLSIKDLNRVRLLEYHGTDRETIHEEICKRCIVGVLHFEGKIIDYDKSPAGMFKTIAETIITKSIGIESDLEKVFNYYSDNVNIMEQIQMIVCKYTNTSIKEVRNYSIDKLLKDYAILHRTYPTEIAELRLEKKEEEG